MIDIMEENENTIKLVPTLSDRELAERHKSLIIKASEPLMEALSAALNDGFISQLNFGEDAFKRVIIQHFSLLRKF